MDDMIYIIGLKMLSQSIFSSDPTWPFDSKIPINHIAP